MITTEEEDELLELLENRKNWKVKTAPSGRTYFSSGGIFQQKFQIWSYSMFYTDSWYMFPDICLDVDTNKISELYNKLIKRYRGSTTSQLKKIIDKERK